MFSGKKQAMRSPVRKMIYETLHVKILRTDQVTTVCCNCLTDVLYFYSFKINASTNQHNLSRVDKINLPDLNTTGMINEWLNGKKRLIERCQVSTDSELHENTLSDSRGFKGFNKKTGFAAISPKTCEINKPIENNITQENSGQQTFAENEIKKLLKTSNSQTDSPNYSHKRIQCDILKNNCTVDDKSIQCVLDTESNLKSALQIEFEQFLNGNKSDHTSFSSTSKAVNNISFSANNDAINSLGLLVVKDKSAEYKTCTFCFKSIHKSIFRNHSKSHRKCDFCKRIFYKSSYTQRHMIKCQKFYISKIQNNTSIPLIYLTKIEHNPCLMREYPETLKLELFQTTKTSLE
ncbi:hypothetical protein ABEB36_002969 [Hypothenemus hampei]